MATEMISILVLLIPAGNSTNENDDKSHDIMLFFVIEIREGQYNIILFNCGTVAAMTCAPIYNGSIIRSIDQLWAKHLNVY